MRRFSSTFRRRRPRIVVPRCCVHVAACPSQAQRPRIGFYSKHGFHLRSRLHLELALCFLRFSDCPIKNDPQGRSRRSSHCLVTSRRAYAPVRSSLPPGYNNSNNTRMIPLEPPRRRGSHPGCVLIFGPPSSWPPSYPNSHPRSREFFFAPVQGGM